MKRIVQAALDRREARLNKLIEWAKEQNITKRGDIQDKAITLFGIKPACSRYYAAHVLEAIKQTMRSHEV